MHVITAIIGAGVLSLPAAMVPLGYAGGSICFLVFGLITVYTAHLLADCYCVNGLRQRTYTELVDTVFGRKGEIAVAWIQLVNLILTAWPYQILGAKTMAALAKEACGALGRGELPRGQVLYHVLDLRGCSVAFLDGAQPRATRVGVRGRVRFLFFGFWFGVFFF